MSSRILVLGCGDLGSAVAHRLFLQGANVVLADVQAPLHLRRSRAFTNTWFDGTSMLDGVEGALIDDARDLVALLEVTDAVLCTATAHHEVIRALRPDAVVDARMREHFTSEDLRTSVPIVLGIGPRFLPGVNCTAAIDTTWGDRLGAVLHRQPMPTLPWQKSTPGDAGRGRFIHAPCDGVWYGATHIGDRVIAGDVIGTLMNAIGNCTIHASTAGVLRGLMHDGVKLAIGQKLLESDSRMAAATQGLGSRPDAIARGVSRAMGLPCDLSHALVHFKMPQWHALPLGVRETLLETRTAGPAHVQRLSRFLHSYARQLNWPDLPTSFKCAANVI